MWRRWSTLDKAKACQNRALTVVTDRDESRPGSGYTVHAEQQRATANPCVIPFVGPYLRSTDRIILHHQQVPCPSLECHSLSVRDDLRASRQKPQSRYPHATISLKNNTPVQGPSMDHGRPSTMFWRGIRGIYVLLLADRFSNALTIPTEGTLGTTPAPLIGVPAPSSPRLAANLTDIQIDCQGSRYGRGLRYSSCLDAFRTFQHGATENPVEIRRRGAGQAARKLPWMWVSGMRKTALLQHDSQ